MKTQRRTFYGFMGIQARRERKNETSREKGFTVRTTDQNRVTMLNSVLGVANNFKNVWKDHVAFADGVAALNDARVAIDAQNQIAQGNPGASDAKEQARLTLCRLACEVIGAVRAYAAVNADPELAAKVDYTESDVTGGRASEVVVRCKTIQAAATENEDELGKYGITNGKLTLFKKAIDAFDKAKSAPRQGRVTKSAATQLLPQLVRSAMAIVRDQLDGLMLQFKEASPNFYEEYFAARWLVNNRGSRTEKAQQSITPLPSTTPVSKAA